jgi:hypothetical protein
MWNLFCVGVCRCKAGAEEQAALYLLHSISNAFLMQALAEIHTVLRPGYVEINSKDDMAPLDLVISPNNF